jgi:hypothetical protein
MSEESSEKKVMLKKFNGSSSKKANLKTIGLVFVLAVLGVGSGYLLSTKTGSAGGGPVQRHVEEGEEIKKGTTVGVADEGTFKDTAEGKLEKGGIDGEGSHHLVRPGGESQNVYLTSSLIDLDKFEGREVMIWGETFSAQTAGWLMDVGKLKVLD